MTLWSRTEDAGDIRRYAGSDDLPPAWDRHCSSLMQQQRMLQHYERYNPCEQRYYGLWRDGSLRAGAVVYTLEQDLLTLREGRSCPVRVNVVGLPASVSPAGVVGAPGDVSALLAAIFRRERGLTVALNQPVGMDVGRAVAVRMLPDMRLPCRFQSFADYERSLRSPWRRRLRHIRSRFDRVETVHQDCRAFSDRHHALYLAVMARARHRLEVLEAEFFRRLPAPIELVSCYAGRQLLCWRLILAERGRLTFLLGGHDHHYNEAFATYFNNLFGLLEDGLRHGAREIELGQTAEDAKARLGARPVETRMLLGHHRGVVRGLLRLFGETLAYRDPCPGYHVFRCREVAA
jgi:hypothetical protein